MQCVFFYILLKYRIDYKLKMIILLLATVFGQQVSNITNGTSNDAAPEQTLRLYTIGELIGIIIGALCVPAIIFTVGILYS